MTDPAVPVDTGLRSALTQLESILIRDEKIEAWAAQRRLFALFKRRLLVAATSNRLIALNRGPFGGFDYTDMRWQDLKEVRIRVGVVGATLHVTSEPSADLASAERAPRTLAYSGLHPTQAQAVYRICQAQDQAWREKRRIREMEELRAKAGGVQILGGTPGHPAGETVDVMRRLEQARQMVEAQLISDAEYEAIKAKILGGS
jgi:hypothetical protein